MAAKRGPMDKVQATFYYHPIFGHCVRKTIAGDMHGTSVEARVTQEDVEDWPVEFERYMGAYRNDAASGGTPLTSIPGMDPNHAGLYALKGINTVEDLVGLNDTMANDLPGNGVVLRDVARIMLKNKQLTGEIAPMPEFEPPPSKLPDRNSMIIDPPADVLAKRGPGRPPKVKVTETVTEIDDVPSAEMVNG